VNFKARPTRFVAELGNYNRREQDARIELRIDGTLHEERQIACPPGLNTFEFEYQFPVDSETSTGHTDVPTESHYATVSITGDDLPEDNRFVLPLEVRRTIPVLVIENQVDTQLWDSDGGYLSAALESAAEQNRTGLFQVQRKPLVDFGRFQPGDLDGFKVVVLVNIPSISRDTQFLLEQFVRRGGGLMVALGPDCDSEAYAELWRDGTGLVPAQLDRIMPYTVRPFRPTFPAGPAKYVLDIFDLSRTRVLNQVRVEKFWVCKPAQDAFALALFEDAPFLLYRPFGEGRTLLWTTSVDTAWTNFPVTRDYLPLLQNLATYLAASIQPPIRLAQGEALVCTWADRPGDPDTDKSTATCELVDPDGISHELTPTRVRHSTTVEWADTQKPGLYTLSAPGRPPKYFAVTCVPGEGNLRVLDADQRDELQDTVVTAFVDDYAALQEQFAAEVGARQWWRWLVMLTILVLAAESYIAWRFSR